MSENLENPKNSLVLFEIEKNLEYLVNLIEIDKFPKVLMLSGRKGEGKFTLINHFLSYFFDKDNYELKKRKINIDSNFYKQYLNNTFPNIHYLSGEIYNNVKIDNIRDLKSSILKTSILNKKRFIVLDDVEQFNINCLNALLKIIEEPTKNNYFVLINNKTKPLIETIHSRSLEIRLKLNNQSKKKIISSLIQHYNINATPDLDLLDLTPGNFIRFNKICIENSINIKDNILKNLEKIFEKFRKNKDKNYINLIFTLVDFYFKELLSERSINFYTIIRKRSFFISNIQKFLMYNLNQKSLINELNRELSSG